ncbi:MAG: hypothetical protein EOO46_21840, partial [Flavobacterium sp.]
MLAIKFDMFKLLAVILYIGIVQSCFCQQELRNYKELAIKVLSKHFDKDVLNNVKCTKFIAKGDEEGDGADGHYETNQTILIDTTWDIGLFFEVHNNELDYDVPFSLTIAKDGNFFGETKVIEQVPSCVRRNQHCGFINQRTAISIAKRNSIQYPDNLNAQLVKPKKSEEYFWIVIGQDKNAYNYNDKDNELKWTVLVRRQTNTRVIKAKTGELIYWVKRC